MSVSNKLRHRLYREHKYVSSVISRFRETVARADFLSSEMMSEVKVKLTEIMELMHGHAFHENTVIHKLLRVKSSKIFEKIERDHAAHEGCFSSLFQLLEEVTRTTEAAQKIELGYQFYLKVQHFEADNLRHQLYEEEVILKELHRLYTDEELLLLTDAKSYAVMTPDDLLEMLDVLFPYFNADDRQAFLSDIYFTEPDKFIAIWPQIQKIISHEEIDLFRSKFEGVS